MKIHRAPWLAATLFALTVSPLLIAQTTGAEKQVEELVKQGREAAVKGDTSFQEKYLADDYLGIGGTGQAVTKQEAIQSRKNGDLKYESIDVRDTKVRTYGNTAVVNSHATVKGTFKGEDISGDYRVTHVWVKQGGGWKQVNFQTTKVTGH